MNHTIIIQVIQKEDGKVDVDVALRGDIHLLSKGIAASMQREESFRIAVMEAIENLVAGYKFDSMKIRDPLKEGGDKVG